MSTPPDPHNTNASPPIFSELLAKSTPGPFKAARSHEDFDGPIFDLEEGESKPFVRIYGGTETVFNCHDLATIKDADAELITRLLNFAHAGGVSIIESAYQQAQAFTGAHPDLTSETRAALMQCIQILNGQPK